MLYDDEIVIFVQEESDPVDDETGEDEDNNNNEGSKGPSNADAFSALETAMEGYEQQSECCPTQLLLLKRIIDTCRKKQVIIFHNIKPTASSAAIQAHVAPSLGAPVSSQTIRRHLAKGHLGSRRPLRVLPFTPTHRRLRLKWCPARGNWTNTEWNQVIFSDESRFDLSSDDNHDVRVWRPRGEHLNPAFALQRHTTPTAGVMEWGAIAYNIQSPLVLIHATMTAQRYVHDILQPHVLPLMQRLPGAIFQQNNASPHMARAHKTVSALLLPFLGSPDSQICLQSRISGIIWDGELGIPRV
ncbi:transposable element Tcb2 transposase [Trichonephila clavipes]|nr:transposable element Tcb2 transposase [Trichonephila clavipes]